MRQTLRYLVNYLGKFISYTFAICSLILLLVILYGLFHKSGSIIRHHHLSDLLFSSDWKPAKNSFGFASFLYSTLLVTFIASLISFPLCLLSAVYLTEYASRRMLNSLSPLFDILAGIPSVIYGLWGVLIIVPFIRDDVAPAFGYHSTGYSILSAGLVLAVMIFPILLHLLLELLKTVPVPLKEAALSLGATKWETIKLVFLRKGSPGILSAFGLGFSKALGETIAVLMVIGNVVQIPQSVFDSGYTLPGLIANNYGEMLSIPSYDSALMFGSLLLFVIILAINIFFRYIIYKSEVI